MSEFDIVIGLEVHAQLNTESKIFCSCFTESAAPANTNICPVCCGYPGVLPVFNQRALELAVRAALALNCRINDRIYFERKNYFYPDLPKNYQISQYKLPLGEEGFLKVTSGRRIEIKRVHLEEDAGKLIHKENYSLVDFNRAGTPLLEIVSGPDIYSSEEAADYLNYLKLTLQYTGVSDCDMEKGSLRCDANISLKKKGHDILGTKVELKNMNTFKGIKDALDYEVKRQESVLNSGDKIFQETRLWDINKSKTFVMRTKEEAHDYRYFPEPDLLDFSVRQEFIAKEKEFIKEFPLDKKKRFIKNYELPEKDADFLISNLPLADFFEQSCRYFNEPKKISNWLLGPFLEQMNVLPEKFKGIKISPQNFVKVVKYFTEGRLNNLTAKKALSLSITTDKDIDSIILEEGLLQVSGEEDLADFIKQVIEGNPHPVKEYQEGKQQAIMFLVGQVMGKTKGKANPRVVKEMLEKSLTKSG